MVQCVVPGCPSQSSNLKLDFYNIPRAPILFQRWSLRLNIERQGRNSSMSVCSLHFLETDFWVNSKGQRLLKRNAVPTNIRGTRGVLNAVGGESKSSTTSEEKHVAKVWKPHHLYRECKECKVVLTPKGIGRGFFILLCPSEECTFPLGENIMYKYLYRKLPNNELQQCTHDEAPTLKEIVEILSE